MKNSLKANTHIYQFENKYSDIFKIVNCLFPSISVSFHFLRHRPNPSTYCSFLFMEYKEWLCGSHLPALPFVFFLSLSLLSFSTSHNPETIITNLEYISSVVLPLRIYPYTICKINFK